MYLPVPHPVCTEHASGHVSGGIGGLCCVTTQHCWQYSLLHQLSYLCHPYWFRPLPLPLAKFCGLPLGSYKEDCAVLQHNTVGSTHCYTTCPPCATPIGSFHYALPFATFCGLPLGSYREVSALCERIVSVYRLNLL